MNSEEPATPTRELNELSFAQREACGLTKRAPDGWDSARFLGLFLSYSSFPFPSLFLASRR
jgi:hypothetical protein